jgi:hypothetical protein
MYHKQCQAAALTALHSRQQYTDESLAHMTAATVVEHCALCCHQQHWQQTQVAALLQAHETRG